MDRAFKHGLYPPPATAEWGDGTFDLTGGAIFEASAAIPTIDTERFVQELRDAGCSPIAPSISERSDGSQQSAKPAGGMLRATLTTSARTPAPDISLDPMPAEGFRIVINQRGATVLAGDIRGMAYGLDAVARMARANDGKLPHCRIEDEPSVEVRGVHVFLPARVDLPFFHRMLEFLARYRYNTVYLELAAGMQFESHPEINTAWERFHRDLMTHPLGPKGLQESMWFDWKNDPHADLAGGSWLTKDEVRGIIDTARNLHVEIIPEVQSLAHSYWLTTAHPEIAEAQDDPYPDTYCPSNPKSYEILFDCMEEIVEIFQPRTIHIGHDEVYTMHRCEKCRKRSAADLFAEDVMRIHDWLADRGIRTAMWADKLLDIHHPDGNHYGGVLRRVFKDTQQWVMPPTAKAVESLSRDIVLVDWYWMLDDKTPDLMAERGFTDLVFGNFTPGGMAHWKEYREKGIVKGAEISTWVGASERILTQHARFPQQFIEGAANLWWRDYDSPVHRDPARVIAQQLTPGERVRITDTPLLIDTARRHPDRYAPVSLDPTVCDAFPPAPDAKAIDRFASGGGRYDGIPFSVPDVNGKPGAVTVRFTSPIKRIGLNVNASGIVALIGTSIERRGRTREEAFHLGPDVAAQLRFCYGAEDDPERDRVVLDLVYGETLFPWTGPPRGYWADPVVQAKADGARVTLYAVPWVNPWPNRAIRMVELVWRGGRTMEGEVSLFAITAEMPV
mgnify:CR=1 FL=1